MKILFAGDIFGSPGRDVFLKVAKRLRSEGEVDFIVINGENASGGRGPQPKNVDEILQGGADIVTLGDHTWDQRDLKDYLKKQNRVVRPANFSPSCPGRGFTTISTPAGNISVISVIGRIFMPNPYDCPFRKIDEILRKETLAKTIIVEIHAEATSEKMAMGWHVDGRVTAVGGTHTHVQTADERLLPKGTAYITDLGMTGPVDSIIGSDPAAPLFRFQTGMPSRFSVASGPTALHGVILDVDGNTGKARSIKRVSLSE